MDLAICGLEETCRTCGTLAVDKTELISLFERTEETATANVLPNEIQILLFTLKCGFNQNDGLPQQICTECLQTLILVNEFRKKCWQIRGALKCYYEAIKLPAPPPHRLQIVEKEHEQAEIEQVVDCFADQEHQGCFDEEWPILESEQIQKLFDEIDSDSELSIDEEDNIEKCGDEPVNLTNDCPNASTDEKLERRECKYCKLHFIHIASHISMCGKFAETFCKYCNLQIGDAVKMIEHVNKEHSDGVFICWFCAVPFKTKMSRRMHMSYVHKFCRDEAFCAICKAHLKTMKSFILHYEENHAEPTNRKCEICHSQCRTDYLYEYHMEAHSKYTNKCKFCERIFIKPSTRDEHEYSHSEVPSQYLCEKCGKSFSQITALKKHNFTYHYKTPRPYPKCNDCNKTFKAERLLKNHKRIADELGMCPINVSKSKYLCNLCGSEFNYIYKLREHNFMHHFNCKSEMEPELDENGSLKRSHPFKCSVCSSGFSSFRGLSRHMKLHDADRPYACDRCPLRFKKHLILNSHIKSAHTERKKTVACPVCDKKFTTRYAMIDHKKFHDAIKPYKCSQCPATFVKPFLLRFHERRNHTGELSFTCFICNLKFHSHAPLKFHTMNVHSNDEIETAQRKFLKESGLLSGEQSNGENVIKSGILYMDIEI